MTSEWLLRRRGRRVAPVVGRPWTATVRRRGRIPVRLRSREMFADMRPCFAGANQLQGPDRIVTVSLTSLIVETPSRVEERSTRPARLGNVRVLQTIARPPQQIVQLVGIPRRRCRYTPNNRRIRPQSMSQAASGVMRRLGQFVGSPRIIVSRRTHGVSVDVLGQIEQPRHIARRPCPAAFCPGGHIGQGIVSLLQVIFPLCRSFIVLFLRFCFGYADEASIWSQLDQAADHGGGYQHYNCSHTFFHVRLLKKIELPVPETHSLNPNKAKATEVPSSGMDQLVREM